MYRLSRLFVSDITAGENLLRNAYVPVFRENGDGDHGVLFAANGTCKTTLLSFIFNVFSPEKRRFVQYLQSGGDKSLEQYLIPGRPAVVLLDLTTVPSGSLFSSAFMDHLVLGQMFYRHSSAPDKISRTHFIAQSADFFDELRQNWDHLLRQQQPHTAVRDFITPKVQQTTSQKEWTDNLARLGLDPWLIDRQIDFAKNEGGIKDAFKFRSETDFLSFFLGCVADMEAAATLRSTLSQSIQKIEDRPQKISRSKAARHLKEQITAFEAIACQWRNACDEIKDRHDGLAEASHLLTKAERVADEKLDRMQTEIETAKAERNKALFQLKTTRANQQAAQRFQTAQTVSAAETGIEKAGTAISQLEDEQAALAAAEMIAEIRKNRTEAEDKDQALRRADAKLAPVMDRIDAMAGRYHFRLEDERRHLRNSIDTLKAQQIEAEQTRQTIADRIRHTNEAREAADEKLSRISAQIQAAEDGRNALELASGEMPENARRRIKDETAAIEGRIKETVAQTTALEDQVAANEDKLRQLQSRASKLEASLERAEKQRDEENRRRTDLLNDPHLQRAAGASGFEPTSAELASRLDDAIARRTDRITEQTREQLALENDLERLHRTETLAADEQVHRLISHYQEVGVKPGELKSFPEYLASLYEAPEDMATLIEKDPGRFTGIMAVRTDVIETVRNLPVPEWLNRPVVVSTHGPPESLSTIAHDVICPPDPRVYSKHHMADIRILLEQQIEAEKQKIDAETKALKGMESVSHRLHAYQKVYPNRNAVTVLADQVREQGEDVSQVTQEIRAIESATKDRRYKKQQQEELHRRLTADLTRQTERLHQVDKWLERYKNLPTWQQEKEELQLTRAALINRIADENCQLSEIQQKITALAVDIRVKQTQLEGIDSRAGDVPRPGDMALSPVEQQAALDLDLTTLRQLYEQCRENHRQMANELGIESLRKEYEAIQSSLANQEARLEAFRYGQPHDTATADAWAARSSMEREKRKDTLAHSLEEQKGARIRLKFEIDHLQERLRQIDAELATFSEKGIVSDLAESDMAKQDLDGLLLQLESLGRQSAETHRHLETRCQALQDQAEILNTWHHEIQLGIAETRPYPPAWDNESPRVQWPELINTETEEARIEEVRAMRNQVQKMMAAEKETRSAMENARRKMGAAFERLMTDLQGDNYKRHLPAVVDELKAHDAESLGAQSREMIQRCEDIARNIESDLEISQKIVDNLVDMILQRSREYHQKLQTAAQQTIAEDVYIYGKKPILRAGTRLDFAKHSDVFRQAVENWLYELIQQNRMPEVNARAGNSLGAEVLYQLLSAATGKKNFGIRLLKCDDTGRNYEPVGKDLGSGGEALTTAVLLYSLLISMRKKRGRQDDGRIPAFLFLDNPLGVCNRSDFLDAQLKVARAMGIQCVYLTGINDRESLDLFELRVAIRKGGKCLEIDNVVYNCLEVTELNLEKQHGSNPA
ncbi:MAG: hypothetical protein ACQERN_12180 [Thermodesulfobacteriota bacterium]